MGRSVLPTECVSCAERSPSPSPSPLPSPSPSPSSTSSSHHHANPAAETSNRASNSVGKSNRSGRRRGGKTQTKGSKEAGREAEVRGERGSGSGSVPYEARKVSESSPSSRVSDDFQNAERPANPKEEGEVEEAMATEAFPTESSMATEAYPAESLGLVAFRAWCRVHAVAFYGEQKPRIDVFVARMVEWRRRAQLLMQRAWPPLHYALAIVGSIAATLALAWFNCTIQGFKSLVRLGSAALFMVICCSALNLGILGGFIKLFTSLVLSAVAAFFLGYIYALVIFGIFSGVILWLCGSFWLTGGIVFVGGVLFIADQPRLALLVGLLYSMYSAKNNGGWLVLFLCLNLAFIFSNLMIYLLHSNGPDTGARDFTWTTQGHSNQENKNQSRKGKQSGAFYATGSTDAYQAELSGTTRGATTNEGESSAVEKEVERVLSCKDHYAVLELSRFAKVDIAALKRDYRKKAMLVHPDKNLGNAVAEEAFKRLQNAYEVLLDPSKKQGYDDELKREEVLLALKRFHQEVLRNGRAGASDNWCTHSEDEGEDSTTRRIVCKKCSNMHCWICTDRNKLHARWCQECQDYHQAKDGDGWVEQVGHAFFFGLFQKVDMPRAYACADSKIYEVTEWVQCQGMKCLPNTHKPSFHVSTSGMFKNQWRGTRANKTAYGNGADSFPFAQLNENMTEEEFIKWLENAMASGVFSDMNEVPDQPDAKANARGKAGQKKRKGKNKW